MVPAWCGRAAKNLRAAGVVPAPRRRRVGRAGERGMMVKEFQKPSWIYWRINRLALVLLAPLSLRRAPLSSSHDGT